MRALRAAPGGRPTRRACDQAGALPVSETRPAGSIAECRQAGQSGEGGQPQSPRPLSLSKGEERPFGYRSGGPVAQQREGEGVPPRVASLPETPVRWPPPPHLDPLPEGRGDLRRTSTLHPIALGKG